MKRKVCVSCKLFVEGEFCPLCKNSKFSNNFKGRYYILDKEKSEIAQKMKIKHEGEYAIKVS